MNSETKTTTPTQASPATPKGGADVTSPTPPVAAAAAATDPTTQVMTADACQSTAFNAADSSKPVDGLCPPPSTPPSSQGGLGDNKNNNDDNSNNDSKNSISTSAIRQNFMEQNAMLLDSVSRLSKAIEQQGTEFSAFVESHELKTAIRLSEMEEEFKTKIEAVKAEAKSASKARAEARGAGTAKANERAVVFLLKLLESETAATKIAAAVAAISSKGSASAGESPANQPSARADAAAPTDYGENSAFPMSSCRYAGLIKSIVTCLYGTLSALKDGEAWTPETHAEKEIASCVSLCADIVPQSGTANSPPSSPQQQRDEVRLANTIVRKVRLMRLLRTLRPLPSSPFDDERAKNGGDFSNLFCSQLDDSTLEFPKHFYRPEDIEQLSAYTRIPWGLSRVVASELHKIADALSSVAAALAAHMTLLIKNKDAVTDGLLGDLLTDMCGCAMLIRSAAKFHIYRLCPVSDRTDGRKAVNRSLESEPIDLVSTPPPSFLFKFADER